MEQAESSMCKSKWSCVKSFSKYEERLACTDNVLCICNWGKLQNRSLTVGHSFQSILPLPSGSLFFCSNIYKDLLALRDLITVCLYNTYSGPQRYLDILVTYDCIWEQSIKKWLEISSCKYEYKYHQAY